MRNDREYDICKTISNYMKLRYPNVIFHFDYAGLNLSKAQAGKMKTIQKERGWPDLFIAYPNKIYHGCFIEIKKENTKLYKKDGYTPVSDHIAEQIITLFDLSVKGYYTGFAIGFNEVKIIIDNYLKK